MKSPRGFDDEKKLEDHFRLLKDAFSLPDDMELKWFRDNSCRYKGLVSRDLRTVYIFEEDLEEAKKVLTHEVLDKLVTCLIKSGHKPNESLYYQKEAVVDSIVPLIDLDHVRDVSHLQEDDEFVRGLRDYHLKKYLQRGAWFEEKYGNSLESVSDAWERIKENREKIKNGDFGGVRGVSKTLKSKKTLRHYARCFTSMPLVY